MYYHKSKGLRSNNNADMKVSEQCGIYVKCLYISCAVVY